MGKFQMTEEYAFGPWILKISENYPIPKLFEPYFNANKQSLLVVKIPRDLERQQIRGLEHLYDYVIALYEEYIYILKRVGNEVEQMQVLYHDIECVENFVDLLDGKFTLYLHDKKIEIRYNSVSEDIIQEILHLIRGKYAQEMCNHSKLDSISLDFKNIKFKRMDDVYRTLLNQLKREGSCGSIIAMQPSFKIRTENSHRIKKLYQILIYKKLLSSLYLVNSKELIIISRGKYIKNFREAVYSYAHVFIPLGNILDKVIESVPEYRDTVSIVIKTKNYRFNNYFEGENSYLENIKSIPEMKKDQ